jgi:GNAT superfamily N-acetyltransferase
MIGVRPTEQGHGYARELLEHVHALAEADPASAGVSLTTETAVNLPFYQRFGYRLLGHSRVGPDLETWGFFRPRDRSPAT